MTVVSAPYRSAISLGSGSVFRREAVKSAITLGELQVAPPSAVFENNAGPLKAAVCRLALGLPVGDSIWRTGAGCISTRSGA
jgi:hypothetical protein